MVDGEGLVLEEDQHKDGEDGQREELLDHFELPEVERTAILNEAYTIGWHHETVFDQSNTPTEKDDHRQRELTEPSRTLQLQVTIPCKCHEDIRTNKKQECI